MNPTPDSGTDPFTAASAIALKPRRKPRQARSVERYERILDATAELLEEAGVEGISTRLIAQRAEVNVATLYQFFPNKYAILNALAERTAARLLERHTRLTGSIDPSSPLRETSERVLQGLITVITSTRGFFPLRRAMRAFPELAGIQAIEERTKRAIADRITQRLLTRHGSLSSEHREVIAQTMIHTTLALIELSTQVKPSSQAGVLEELRTMMYGYLSGYFSVGRPPRADEAQSDADGPAA